jgi:heterodisulfide reductase subunit D
MMRLEKIGERMFSCNGCGACYGRGPQNPFRAEDFAPIGFCPMINHNKFQAYSARGLSFVARGVHYEGLPITDDLVKIAYTCTGCLTCEEVCKPIPTTDIVRGLREEIFGKGMQPDGTKRIDEKIADNGNRFGFENALRDKWAQEIALPGKGDDVYFTGCSTALSPQLTRIAVVTSKILKQAGLNVAYLGGNEKCCGMPAGWNGNIDLQIKMAKNNVEAMKSAGAKRIIFTCPECFATWSKDYPELLGKLPFETIHISQLLVDLIERGKIEMKKSIEKTVTFQDPCHLGRRMKIYDEPREVLKNIPGITLKEMNRSQRWSYCCGFGSMAVYHAYPQYALRIAAERLQQINDKADNVVTTCPQCYLILNAAAKSKSVNCKVHDLSILVAESMQL